MRDERHVPGPFDIDELISRQLSYELAVRAGKYRFDHLDTGYSLQELWELKESFERLEDH